MALQLFDHIQVHLLCRVCCRHLLVLLVWCSRLLLAHHTGSSTPLLAHSRNFHTTIFSTSDDLSRSRIWTSKAKLQCILFPLRNLKVILKKEKTESLPLIAAPFEIWINIFLQIDECLFFWIHNPVYSPALIVHLFIISNGDVQVDGNLQSQIFPAIEATYILNRKQTQWPSRTVVRSHLFLLKGHVLILIHKYQQNFYVHLWILIHIMCIWHVTDWCGLNVAILTELKTFMCLCCWSCVKYFNIVRCFWDTLSVPTFSFRVKNGCYANRQGLPNISPGRITTRCGNLELFCCDWYIMVSFGSGDRSLLL